MTRLEHIFYLFFDMGTSSIVFICVIFLLRKYFIKKNLKALKWLWIAVALKLLCPIHVVREPVAAALFSYSNSSSKRKFIVTPKDTRIPTVSFDVYSRTGQIIALIWLVGIAALAAISIAMYIVLKHNVYTRGKKEGNIWRYGADSAFVMGFFQQEIVLPDIDSEDVRFMLDHEKEHLKRHDNLKKIAGYTLLILNWYNPMIWYAFHCFCFDIELCCDRAVTEQMDSTDRKNYINALLKNSLEADEYAIYLNYFSGADLRKRIEHLVSPHNYKVRKPVIFVSLFIMLIMSLCGNIGMSYGSDNYDSLMKRAEVMDEDFEKGGITEKVIINARGQFVFKNPSRAYAQLKNKYSYELSVLRNKYHLPKFTPAAGRIYVDCDWLVENENYSETFKKNVAFINGFADIYENDLM